MCKSTKYLNGRILSEKESMCVTTLLREDTFYPPGNRRKSAAAPSSAVLPSAASTVTAALLEAASSGSPGPFLSRGGGQPLCSRRGVRACVRKRGHELLCSNRLSDEIFTIKQHCNALTITVPLHYIVKIWSLLFFTCFYRKIKIVMILLDHECFSAIHDCLHSFLKNCSWFTLLC